jgi:hypothetical protein
MYVMRQLLVAAVAAVTVMASGNAGLAQGVPAEIPSASFRGDQYVDSRGCAFVRVGVGGNTQWVPRVGRDRRQLCGFAPSNGSQVQTAATTSAPPRQPGVTVIGGGATAATAPRVPQAAPIQAAPQPVVRSIATQPRPPASQPRNVATTPRVIAPQPQPQRPAAAGACPNLPADIRSYFTGPNPRCGPQAVHPSDAARGIDRSSALGGAGAAEIRQVVRYEVNPPPGYRAAWEDGRLNPYRGLAFAGGQRQMEEVWTNTVPHRLVGTEPRGLRAIFARPSRPAELVPAQVTILRP